MVGIDKIEQYCFKFAEVVDYQRILDTEYGPDYQKDFEDIVDELIASIKLNCLEAAHNQLKDLPDFEDIKRNAEAAITVYKQALADGNWNLIIRLPPRMYKNYLGKDNYKSDAWRNAYLESRHEIWDSLARSKYPIFIDRQSAYHLDGPAGYYYIITIGPADYTYRVESPDDDIIISKEEDVRKFEESSIEYT